MKQVANEAKFKEEFINVIPRIVDLNDRMRKFILTLVEKLLSGNSRDLVRSLMTVKARTFLMEIKGCDINVYNRNGVTPKNLVDIVTSRGSKSNEIAMEKVGKQK